jgi:hypothetical protein
MLSFKETAKTRAKLCNSAAEISFIVLKESTATTDFSHIPGMAIIYQDSARKFPSLLVTTVNVHQSHIRVPNLEVRMRIFRTKDFLIFAIISGRKNKQQ